MDHRSENTIKIEYVMKFKNDYTIKRYGVKICKDRKRIIASTWKPDKNVFWSDLEFNKCSNCPLNASTRPKCPIAFNLQSLVEVFSDNQSIDEIEIEVHMPQRIYKKETTLQYGLQALFGLLMASSGCPKMKFLAPMALFHTPFSDVEETLLRSASFYLMNQFFNKLDGKASDFSMAGLKEHYKDVEEVNKGILARIRAVDNLGEANANAVVVLNTFAQMFSFQHEYDLKMLKYLFKD